MTNSDAVTNDPSQFRTDPPRIADERAMYQSWLDFHRGTLVWKCAGLTDAQLKTASVRPSTLTLLGLLRHMAEVERWWFRTNAAGLELPDLYCPDDDKDGDFDNVADADVTEDLARFKAECMAADEAVRTMSLDDTFIGRRGEISLRWVYVHMIEEYARHNGHADLLRECIDGATGA
ncbi:MAG: DinB family protein [Dermatophilaceae bacterium]